jgi:hypothetical protein
MQVAPISQVCERGDVVDPDAGGVAIRCRAAVDQEFSQVVLGDLRLLEFKDDDFGVGGNEMRVDKVHATYLAASAGTKTVQADALIFEGNTP